MIFLNRIVHFSLHNPLIILLVSLAFFIISISSIRNIKMDALPDVTSTQVQVVTSAPSLSALEIEEYVTYPVEWAMAGLPQLEEVRSISRYGLSLLTLVFTEGTDIYTARQLVTERLLDISNQVPPEYGRPEIAPLTTALGEVVQFTLESDIHDNKELTTILQWYIFPILKTVPGVVDVNLFGGEIEEFHIELNLNRMQNYGINIQEVMESIQNNNILEGGGYIEKNREHTLIGIQSRIKNINDIKKISINKRDGSPPIYLENFSNISIGNSLRKGAATTQGKKEVVGGIALMYMGENALQVSESVAQKLNDIRGTLPRGMDFNVFYNRSNMVMETIQTVAKNLIEGAILIIVILFVMLGNIRSGLIIAVVIPLCMLFAMFIMVIRDAPANLMSMGAVDFGLLVDGAVIVVENAYRRLGLRKKESGRNLSIQEKRETIYSATLEVRRATIFGEMILGVVYIPILLLSGTAGMLFRPMAWTVLYAIGGAFLFTLTIVPVLCFYFLKVPNDLEKEETKIFQILIKKYKSFLTKAMDKKNLILSSAAIFFLIVVSSSLFLGREFIPVLDEGSSLLEITRLPSTSLKESIDSSLRMERALLGDKFPEIKTIVSKTGSPDMALEPMGIEKTDVFILWQPKENWTRSKDQILDELAETIEENFPEVSYGISQPIEMRTNEMVAGIRSDVGIKIFGKDLAILRQEADTLTQKISHIPGITDIRIEQLGGLSYLRIEPDRDKLAYYGFQSRDISLIVQMVASGFKIDQVVDGARRIGIKLRLQDPPDNSTESWETLMIPNSNGRYIPLGELATVKMSAGPAQISHEWQERRVLLEFNVRGRDVLGAVEDVEDILSQPGILPPGYRFEMDGSFQDYRKATQGLGIIVPLAFAMILFLLWRAVDIFHVSLLLFINIPFAVTGGILALWIRGLPFSISAAVGFIALCGIAILNSLVLVTFSLQRESEGVTAEKAIFNASLSRFRPVVMTGLIAILGFLPMAISTNPGAEVQRPLATVVIGGLVTDSLLTLFVFPVFYSRFRGKRKTTILDNDV